MFKARLGSARLVYTPNYVYNPFTGDIISLPRLDMPTHGGDLGCFATFTSDSTSPDCVFIYHRVDIGSLAHA